MRTGNRYPRPSFLLRTSRSRLRAGILAACLVVGAPLVLAPDTAVAAPTPPTPAGPAPAGPQGRVAAPDSVLGTGWKRSSDVLVTGVGDSKGFHLYVAREKDAFAWSTLATLTASALDVGPWTGEVCVTGSGRYAVAVFAPTAAANRPELLMAGGLAAVVDTATGKARQVASGVQLAYFNPACGPGDMALLTRAIGADEQQTDLLSVDAAAGRVTSTRRINAQLTTPVPAPDGDYGIAHGALVKVANSGALTAVAQPKGRPFAVVATANHGVDLVSVDGQRAVAQRFSRGKLTDLGTAAWDRLQLFGLTGGRDALVGDTKSITGQAPELSKLTSDRQVSAVSDQGHLLAVETVSKQVDHAVAEPLSRPDPEQAGSMRATVRAVHSGTTSTAEVATIRAPVLDAVPTVDRTAGPTADGARPRVAAANTDTPACAIPRNDPSVQALQPSPDMVEWAVDQAVHNRLMVNRPANYLKNQLPGYTPQGMFPIHKLHGNGSVPANLMLGILAQETNLSEATWHAVPGDLGNPLIADYYGNGGSGDGMNYDKADCGYGIGQVTDGMKASESSRTYAERVAIATDYAANIAAALNILIDKWNQLMDDPAGQTYVNNGDPNLVENWYLAVWAYNSGFHPSGEAGNNHGAWGVGWLNNPMNPAYEANRHPFLRDSYGDAAKPSHWSYEERVMGWVETPQKKGDGDAYSKPAFGKMGPDSGRLTLPNLNTFCWPSVNSCSPGTAPPADPCGAPEDYCWWHGSTVSFADCFNDQCARESLAYGAGAPEPSVKRIYERDCENFDGSRDSQKDPNPPTAVVYDLNETFEYALGCNVGATDGKFTLRLGTPPENTYNNGYANMDLHQLGAGYNGHMWFTHVYPPVGGDTINPSRQVIGTWMPDLNIAKDATLPYDIVVHLPSHGGVYDKADYLIWTGTGDDAGSMKECVISQDTTDIFGNGHDKWVYLGHYQLGPGARVQLSNIASGADGTVDIAYDAMAFVPTLDRNKGSGCGDAY